jgi:hypothetical protein
MDELKTADLACGKGIPMKVLVIDIGGNNVKMHGKKQSL